MTQYTYQLLYKPEGVNTDITEWVDRIDAIESGSGEIRSAKIRLNAMRGRFVTKDFTNTTPLIDEFDKLRLIITDRNLDTYDVIYEVDNVKPVQNSQIGELMEVECLGMEWHLTKTPFSKPFFQESGFTVGRDIIDFYNDPDSKGSVSPTVFNHTAVYPTGFNNLAKFTANVYPFDLREQSVYTGEMITLDKASGTVSSGGAGEFYELGFEDDLTDPAFNKLKYRAFISGSPPDQSSIPTIDDSLSINPGEEEGGLAATMGFVAGTWLADGIGTYPFENGLFAGGLEVWNQYPEHVSGVTYPNESIIEVRSSNDSDGDFFHYKANKETAIDPPTPPTTSNADWDQYFFTSFVKNEAQVPNAETEGYSRLTKGIAVAWKSCGAKVDGTTQNDPPTSDTVGCWDHNLVIVDGTYARTWVDCIALSPAAIPSQLLYPGSGIFRNFRVLVAGTGTGDFSGFDNHVLQYTGNQWRSFRDYSDNAMVAVDNERKVYQLQSSVWTDISSTREGNDCYHPIYALGNDQGVNDHGDGIGGNYGDDSGVTYEFRYANSDLSNLSAEQYYRMGAWVNWRIPFPPNSFNGNTLGDKIGNATTFEPATLDVGNMHFASNGKVGYNHDRSMDYGPFDSIRFPTKFLWTYGKDGLGDAVRAGNFECRCVIYDSSDNVVTQDFVIPFNGDFTQTIDLPLRDFKIYRGRKPWSFIDAASNVFLQNLEILNRFEFKNIVKIGLVWMGPYDDVGRYQPWGQIGFLLPALENIITNLLVDGFNIKWEVDVWEFSKPGLIISDPIPTGRATMLPFDDQPQIINTFNGLQHNNGQLELAQFRQVRYDIVTEGTCLEKFGDSIFLENDLLVREANKGESFPGANDGIPGTIKLVVKKIRYEITKPSNGPGGFLRYIEGVKRFV